jgi:ribulose-phosphate 3-epimerase
VPSLPPLPTEPGAERPRLSGGIATADLGHLDDEIQRLRAAGVALVHFDVMDGNYAGPITFGPALVAAVSEEVVKDVHLMVSDPLRGLEAYVEAGAGIISFHPEALVHPHRVLQELAGSGVARGVALAPSAPLALLEPLLGEFEFVLLVAVNPGWSGQRFGERTRVRLEQLRELLADAGVEAHVGVDGGIGFGNASEVAALRPDVVVAGSAIFDGTDAMANARRMRRLLGGEEPA